uniref:Uncharacterized protein n=1 Tax=Caenorhabditis japonica TaxID=281687 RepID=A0A8R1IGU7_CAEJA
MTLTMSSAQANIAQSAYFKAITYLRSAYSAAVCSVALHTDQGEGSKESVHQRRRLERVSASKEKARKSSGENSEKSSSGENPKGFRELTLQRVTTEFDTHVVNTCDISIRTIDDEMIRATSSKNFVII